MTGLEALNELRIDIMDRALLFSEEKCDIIEKELKALEIIKRELMLKVKEDNGLYRLITYQSDNHLLRKDQFDLLKEVLL